MTTIHMFDHSSNRVAISAGQLIFAEGDAGDQMYVLVEGEVEISIGSRVLETAGPGALIGEMALIENAPRSATAQAKTDCVVVAVPQREFLFLVQEHPSFAIQVMRVMAERLRRMDHP